MPIALPAPTAPELGSAEVLRGQGGAYVSAAFQQNQIHVIGPDVAVHLVREGLEVSEEHGMLTLNLAGGGRDHARDIATERGDLLDQARAHVAVLERGHEEDAVDPWRELAVVVGELHLDLEVADRAAPSRTAAPDRDNRLHPVARQVPTPTRHPMERCQPGGKGGGLLS